VKRSIERYAAFVIGSDTARIDLHAESMRFLAVGRVHHYTLSPVTQSTTGKPEQRP